MSARRNKAVFVLSDVRSGSTLLDQCLGGHPDVVSLGEVHWLSAYVLEDRSIYDPIHPLVCSCGEPLRVCPFWTKVETTLGRPLQSLILQLPYAAWSGGSDLVSRIRNLPRRFVKTFPASFRSHSLQRLLGCDTMAGDCFALFDAVADATGRNFCVDSSKSPFRFRAVHDREPARTVAILLGRDYRAVVHSKMKRGQTMESAAMGWRRQMTHMEALTSDIPDDRKCRVKFESFCADPAGELARICRFLQMEFSPNMLQRPTTALHNIGGSPSKFDANRVSVVLDRTYENVFEAGALAQMRKLVGGVGGLWGY
jgi:hypothetical protein